MYDLSLKCIASSEKEDDLKNHIRILREQYEVERSETILKISNIQAFQKSAKLKVKGLILFSYSFNFDVRLLS